MDQVVSNVVEKFFGSRTTMVFPVLTGKESSCNAQTNFEMAQLFCIQIRKSFRLSNSVLMQTRHNFHHFNNNRHKNIECIADIALRIVSSVVHFKCIEIVATIMCLLSVKKKKTE